MWNLNSCSSSCLTTAAAALVLIGLATAATAPTADGHGGGGGAGHGNRTGGGHGGECGGGGHHGSVTLASWRWCQYKNYVILCITIILVGVFKIAFHRLHALSNVFPESCLLIVIGIVLGIVNFYSGFDKDFPAFTATLFFNLLLPPIILDASYAIYDRNFLQNLGSVLIYAVIGTLFNVFIIGFALWGLNQAGMMGDVTTAVDVHDYVNGHPPKLDTIQCLTFSSLISAVDPVAVLAIFQEIGVNVSLYFLVFGESLLNDGVTIVLYNTMVALGGSENPATSDYVVAFFSFFTVVFGGLLIGIIVGIICSYILKWSEHTPDVEPLIVFVTAYFAYIFAETVHWSGIISLIGCGIAQKRYGFRNMSRKSNTTVKFATKTLAGFSDAVIFLFLGVTTIRDSHVWQTGFILWTCLLCTVVRFAGVYLLTALLNLTRIKKISWKEQFILSYGGLRGAVGFSLVEILDDKSNPYKNLFVTTTLFMIGFTVFLQGGTIKLFVEKLKIRKKVAAEQMISTDVNEKTMDTMMAGVESITGGIHKHKVLKSFQACEEKTIKKWVVRTGVEDPMALKLEKITVKDHYNRLYGPTIKATKMVEKVNQEHSKVELRNSVNITPSKMRMTMKEALHRSTYERYRHRTLGDSDDELTAEIVEEQRARAKMGWSNAFAGVRMQMRKSRSSISCESQDATQATSVDEMSGTQQQQQQQQTQQQPSTAGERIFQVYKLSKMQFKATSPDGKSRAWPQTGSEARGVVSDDDCAETVALQAVQRNGSSSNSSQL